MTDSLKMILARDGAGILQLWACRGAGSGCARNEHRKSPTYCDDCVGPLPRDLTLGEVAERLARGDA